MTVHQSQKKLIRDKMFWPKKLFQKWTIGQSGVSCLFFYFLKPICINRITLIQLVLTSLNFYVSQNSTLPQDYQHSDDLLYYREQSVIW